MEDSNKTVSQVQQKINLLKKELQEADEKAEAKKDPKLYNELKKEAFDMFLKELETIKFGDPIKRTDSKEKHYIVIGIISSGKTSLLNTIFKLNEPVGLG